MKTYLKSVINLISNSLGHSSINMTSEIDDSINFPVTKAIPCALFINECLLNVIKHVLPQKPQADISIELSKTNSCYSLIFSDNGPGFKQEEKESLGYTLIESFASQLRGNLHVESNKGTTVSIQFNCSEPNTSDD
jgi:two-component sensor histidine kinase